jgi:hypothetical protein
MTKLHFKNKVVGDLDASQGKMVLHFMGMKEAPYVMTMMTTYGRPNEGLEQQK